MQYAAASTAHERFACRDAPLAPPPPREARVARPRPDSTRVERAEEATVKRLRDEARALGRRRILSAGATHGAEPARPLDDGAWHASIRRAPGTARERILIFGRIAAGLGPGAEMHRLPPAPDVFLRLRLPDDLASDFVAAIDASRVALARRVARIPWDVADPRRRRGADAVFIRDGWRCMAPGCTSRRHLEEHHVIYRSRHGSGHLANLLCICRFHHQRGEHGGLATCSGSAPLEVHWRLGRPALGVWYLNERRLAHPGGSP